MAIKKICLDYGHCLSGADTGASGCGFKEEILTREVGRKVRELLTKEGIQVIETVYNNTFNNLRDSLNHRSNVSNNNNVDLFVSIHLNAFNGSAHGTEVFTYGGKEVKEARQILNNIINLGFENRKIKDGKNLAVIKNTKATALLIECCFIDNKSDMDRFNVDKMALAIAEGILGRQINSTKDNKVVTEVKSTSNKVETPSIEQENEIVKTSITGKSVLTKEQMKEYCLKHNPIPQLTCTIDELIEYFLSEGESENIRGDIAFCQAIKETGFFKYGGDILFQQQNFSGIGALNSLKGQKGKGAWFNSPQQGVRAQIQHLKAYANKESLVNSYIIDPRFNLVTRGIAPNWEDLNGRWAVPGRTYGQDILRIYEEIKAIKIDAQEVIPQDTVEDEKEQAIPTINIENILEQLYSVQCNINQNVAKIDVIKNELMFDLQAIEDIKQHLYKNK